MEFDSKLDGIHWGCKLVEAKSLADNAVFVGGSATVCVSSV